MNGGTGARPQDPAVVMLRGGLLPALACGALVSAGAVILSTRAGAGAALGAGCALPALAVVPGLMRWTRGWPAEVVLGLALGVYAAVMALLWWVYSLVSGLSWLSPAAAGVGFGVVTVAWSLGVMRAMRRLRQHLYDLPEAAGGGAAAGAGG